MKKLLYNETIKHINCSIIEPYKYYYSGPDETAMRAYNPVSNTSIIFIKNTVPPLSYKVSFEFSLKKPFTAAESEQLFKYVEKRYNDHFKDADEATISIYRQMLIRNNMTRNK